VTIFNNVVTDTHPPPKRKPNNKKHKRKSNKHQPFIDALDWFSPFASSGYPPQAKTGQQHDE